MAETKPQNNMASVQHVFVIGSKSIGQYSRCVGKANE